MAALVIEDYNDIFSNHDVTRNTTRNVMTKYEKTAVMSLRLEQLTRGASPCLDTEGMTTMRQIALAELKSGVLPFLLVRTLPSDVKEYFRIKDMIILAD